MNEIPCINPLKDWRRDVIGTANFNEINANAFSMENQAMTFVNEKISEVDKVKIDWTQFKAWPFSQPLQPSWWTIDRERNVFLVYLAGRGPDGERPETYALYVNGAVIRFEAESGGKGQFKTGVDMFWKIFKIDIPPQLESKRPEIIEVLREAIDAYGSTHKRDCVKSVYIEIL